MIIPAEASADPGPLTFRLWLPRWGMHGDRLRCRFQATSMGLTQVNEGTPECMSQFLADLGRAGAKNVTWSAERYRTPYFSDFTDAGRWEDKLPMAWSVQVELDSNAEPENAGTHRPGPHGTLAQDVTFLDAKEDWERSRDRVVVLAGDPYGFEPDLAELGSIDGARSVEVIFDGLAAIDLGERALPEEGAIIDAALLCCRQQGLRTNWRQHRSPSHAPFTCEEPVNHAPTDDHETPSRSHGRSGNGPS